MERELNYQIKYGGGGTRSMTNINVKSSYTKGCI